MDSRKNLRFWVKRESACQAYKAFPKITALPSDIPALEINLHDRHFHSFKAFQKRNYVCKLCTFKFLHASNGAIPAGLSATPLALGAALSSQLNLSVK
jgi:hypothetical protein